MKNKLELRMYGLVPYNISPIQQAIQFGHAKDEYSLEHNTIEYREWLKNHKTYIILNGGTTNKNPNCLGTMNKHLVMLKKLGVRCSGFYEPDLGDQLTGIAFILDERIFNKNKYPDYGESMCDTYAGWEKYIGGKKNVKIREYIKDFKLA